MPGRMLVFFVLLCGLVNARGQDTSSVVIVLRDVGVKVATPKIVHRGDTVVFNAEAYKTPEGAILENLVRRLPGVVVGSDGSITYRGKSVSEIKINGKDFFKGNSGVAMKNLPVDIIKEVKVYEEDSREARRSGIPEAEKNQVMDVTLKEELKKTLTLDGHAGLASHRHYDNHIFAQEFTDRWSASLFGDMKNVPESDDFDTDCGLSSTKNAGGTVQWSNKEGEDVSGQFRVYASTYYRYNDNDVRSESASETFLNRETDVYSYNVSSMRNKQRSWENSVDLSWQPDSSNVFTFSASANMESSRSRTVGQSAMFNDNPYQVASRQESLENIFSMTPDMQLRNIIVNTGLNSMLNRGRGDMFSAAAFAAHHFDSLGTSLSADVSYNHSYNRSRTFTLNKIQYYRQGTEMLPTFYDQYVSSPTHPHSLNANASFSYHFNKKSSAFIRYSFLHSYSNEDRSWYELDSLRNVSVNKYPELGWLPSADTLELIKVWENCQYSAYHRHNNSIQLGSHLVVGKWTIRPYVDVCFKHTKLRFTKNTYSAAKRRNGFYIEPKIYSQYKISEQKNISFTYYTVTSSPDLINLIDIPDESNPLYVTMGNPNLKDTWSHSANIWYQSYNTERQENIVIHPAFHQSFNSITNRLVYDMQTGKQTVKSDNINGNMDASLGIDYNRSFGKENMFNVMLTSTNSYFRSVGFVNTGGLQSEESKNVMHDFLFDERVSASCRTDNLEIILTGKIAYNHSRSANGMYDKLNTTVTTLQTQLRYDLPWKMSIGTDFGFRLRRGFADSAMNTSECLWNARVTQSLMQQHLIIGLRYNDILHQRQYITRSVGANSKYETKTNHVGSYLMLTLQYKFSVNRK